MFFPIECVCTEHTSNIRPFNIPHTHYERRVLEWRNKMLNPTVGTQMYV